VPLDGNPAKDDAEKTLKLRRYILGLSLVAALARSEDRYNLREGCQLRQKPGTKTTWREVQFEGDDVERTGLTEEVAADYAKLAAEAFGVKQFPEYEFDQKTAEKWLALDKKVQDKLRRENPMTKQFTSAEATSGEGAGESAGAGEGKPTTRKRGGK
jgi:hypothetical protein